MIVGFGARHADARRARRAARDANVVFLPYQPRELLPESLSSADVHFVGLGQGLAGYVVPSRLYGILAVGRPVIVAADADSETARVVQEVGCGLVIPPGRPDLLAATLRELARRAARPRGDGPSRPRLRRAEAADRSIAFERYRALLGEFAGDRA